MEDTTLMSPSSDGTPIYMTCDSRKYPYRPPTDGQWKFLRGGGAKG